jgi:hypothetical protein
MSSRQVLSARVRILLYMLSHTTTCVLILLYMCRHTTIYVSSYYYYLSSYHYIYVLILLYTCLCQLANLTNQQRLFFLLPFFFPFRSTLRTSKGFPLFSVMWGLAFNREKCIHQLVYLCLQRLPVRASVDE